MKRIRALGRCAALGICVVLFLGNGIIAQADETEAGQTEAVTEQAEQSIERDYTIYVNRAANCVTVMAADKAGSLVPVRAMPCSCGREGHSTPTGTFHTSDYYDWGLMVDGTYGRYAVRIYKGILFHSVPYYKHSPDTLEWDQYNLLGERASLGCVRLSVENAKWIYDNCRRGTTVIVYDDAENPGPLGKPAALKIDADSPYRDWDPTDIDSNNPWYAEMPVGQRYADFDAEGYAERYPDVKEAYGTDKALLWTHYLNYGRAEGRIAFPENVPSENTAGE